MNKTLVILVFAVAIVIGIGALFFVQVGGPTQSLITGATSTAAKLLTYSNPTYGLSFEHGDSYELKERELGDEHRWHYSITLIDKAALAVMPENGEGPLAITIDVYQNDLDHQSAEEWIRNTNDSNYKLSPDGLIGSTTIAGVSALSYQWDGLYRGESIVFVHADAIVMASVTWISETDTIRDDFETVLNSLRLAAPQR